MPGSLPKRRGWEATGVTLIGASDLPCGVRPHTSYIPEPTAALFSLAWQALSLLPSSLLTSLCPTSYDPFHRPSLFYLSTIPLLNYPLHNLPSLGLFPKAGKKTKPKKEGVVHRNPTGNTSLFLVPTNLIGSGNPIPYHLPNE